MKIGYPCINRSIGCAANRTFRLRSYTPERLVETVENNLNCLMHVLHYNLDHRLLFFRITSDLIPFASHPNCRFNWRSYFMRDFQKVGRFIRDNDIRISMHPDQFVLINSPDRNIFKRGVRELTYHADVLDLMELDDVAKIQIHVGGVYGDKEKSMKRFASRYKKLPGSVRRRLVIENDDRLYSLKDCMVLHELIGVPVLFDIFHHDLNNEGEDLISAFDMFVATWQDGHGLPMVDYSEQMKGARRGTHAESLNVRRFVTFLKETEHHNFDIMLEIKDKEKSALRALKAASNDHRIRDAR